MKHELIMSTINKALDGEQSFQFTCEDGHIIPLVDLEIKSLHRIYHKSYWGDFRDEGVEPLLCVEIEFVINKATQVESEEVIEVIVKAFNEVQDVELFECSMEHKVQTRYVKCSNKVITQSQGLVFKVMASQDHRLSL